MPKKSLVIVIIIGVVFLGGAVYLGYRAGWFDEIFGDGVTNEAATTENLDEESDDEETDSWIIPCQSTADSPVEDSISGYDIRVYVAEIPEDYLSYSMLDDSDSRTFSLSEFENTSQVEPAYSAFVNLSTDDDREEFGIEVSSQLCNENNMTNRSLQVSSHALENERAGVTGYLHGTQYYIPTEPGNYRFDGYVYLGDDWHLVGQIDLVFVE